MRVEVALDPGPPLRDRPLAGARPRAPPAALPAVLGPARRRHRARGPADDRRRGARPRRRAGLRREELGPALPAGRLVVGRGARLRGSRAGGRLRRRAAAARRARSRRRRSWPASAPGSCASARRRSSPCGRRSARARGTWRAGGRARGCGSRGSAEGEHLLLPHPEPDDGTFDRRAEHWLDGVVEAVVEGRRGGRWRTLRRRALAARGPGAGPPAGRYPRPPTRPRRALGA